MNRPRIWIEILLLVLVIVLASMVWKSRSNKSQQTRQQNQEVESEGSSKLSGFLQDHKAKPTPTSVPKTDLHSFGHSAGFEPDTRELPVVLPQEPEVPQISFLIINVPGQGPGQEVQVFSTDCGFSTAVINGTVTLELTPGSCRLQLQTMDGAVLIQTDALSVNLPAGETVEIELSLPEMSLAEPGVILVPEDNYAVIQAVIPGSPASQVDMRVGDIVIEIDGTPVNGMSLAELDQLLLGSANSVVRFTLVLTDAAGNLQEAVVQTHRERLN